MHLSTMMRYAWTKDVHGLPATEPSVGVSSPGSAAHVMLSIAPATSLAHQPPCCMPLYLQAQLSETITAHTTSRLVSDAMIAASIHDNHSNTQRDQARRLLGNANVRKRAKSNSTTASNSSMPSLPPAAPRPPPYTYTPPSTGFSSWPAGAKAAVIVNATVWGGVLLIWLGLTLAKSCCGVTWGRKKTNDTSGRQGGGGRGGKGSAAGGSTPGNSGSDSAAHMLEQLFKAAASKAASDHDATAFDQSKPVKGHVQWSTSSNPAVQTAYVGDGSVNITITTTPADHAASSSGTSCAPTANQQQPAAAHAENITVSPPAGGWRSLSKRESISARISRAGGARSPEDGATVPSTAASAATSDGRILSMTDDWLKNEKY